MAVLAFLFLPVAAHALAGGSPFDTGFTAMQNLFTGTIESRKSDRNRDRRLRLCSR
jgi:hypothetical protein